MSPARLAVSLVFLLHGVAVGTRVSRIPAVQANLGLGEAALGLALLGAGLGSLLGMLPVGALIHRHGSRTIVLWAVPAACAALGLISLASGAATLFAALVLWGATSSGLDIAMNAQGSAVEERLGRPVMSSLHGLWSVGTMVGAAAGAFVAGLGVSVGAHFLGAAPLILAAALLAARALVAGGEGQQVGSPFARPRGALLALAAIAFCAVTTEGAMFDWSGVYLRRVLGAPEATAAAAVSLLSAAMAVGRLGGDRLTARLGAPTLARATALAASLGVVAIILAPGPPFVFAVLLAAGLGLSVLVPLAFGAAGRSPDTPAGPSIAAVATMGYLGFLIGPPSIGFAAEQVTLRGAFVLLLLLLGLIVRLAPATDRTPRPSAEPGAMTLVGQPAPAAGRSRDRTRPSG